MGYFIFRPEYNKDNLYLVVLGKGRKFTGIALKQKNSLM